MFQVDLELVAVDAVDDLFQVAGDVARQVQIRERIWLMSRETRRGENF